MHRVSYVHVELGYIICTNHLYSVASIHKSHTENNKMHQQTLMALLVKSMNFLLGLKCISIIRIHKKDKNLTNLFEEYDAFSM